MFSRFRRHNTAVRTGSNAKRNSTQSAEDMFSPLEARCLLSGAGEAAGFTAYFPEGYAHNGISEFVPMTNPNDQDVAYTLTAHYETGKRDQIIASGTIAAHSRGGVTVSLAGRPELMLVRPDTPYALETIRSGRPSVIMTLGQPSANRLQPRLRPSGPLVRVIKTMQAHAISCSCTIPMTQR